MAEEVHGRGWELLAPAHEECDLEQPDAVADFVLTHAADMVVNCAAVSGLEACALSAADADTSHHRRAERPQNQKKT